MIETLIRFNIPFYLSFDFLPYGEGVYFAKLTKDHFGYGPYYSQWTSSTINTSRIIVGSIIASGTSFDKKSNLADCISDEESFYWDNPTQTIYIKFAFDDIPEIKTISIGVVFGYSYKSDLYIDDVLYEARIQNAPVLKKEVDKFEVGKIAFKSQSITLRNGDGGLDYLLDNPIPGSEGSVVLYDTETSTELTIYTGFVSADSFSTEEVTITLDDKRKRENKKVPSGLFSVDDYADIESKYEGKIIPEGYGVCKRIRAFPLNGTVGSGNIQFKYASDATTLTSVEVKEDDVWSDVTGSVANSAPATGYFELPYATATNASGAVLECVVTATLRNYNNPGDIIKDMNDRYNSINYDTTNYDQTEWTSESAKLSDDSFLYMDKKQEFFKWIEPLQNGSNLWFLYDIDGSGKRTIRVNDPNRSASRTIAYYDIKDDDKKIERDFTEYSSTVTVYYDYDDESEVWQQIYVSSYQEDIIAKYRFENDSEYESTLRTEAEAQEKADVISEDQSEVRKVVTVVLHGDNLSDLTDKLYDIANVDLSRPETKYWGFAPDTMYANYSGLDSMYANHAGSDSMYANIGNFVYNGDDRTYAGSIRGQIIGIQYDPSSLDYKLIIRERPVSEVLA